MANTLTQVAAAILDCVSAAMEDHLRPLCKVYKTVGAPVIGTCCECDDEGANGELSIHLMRVFDADQNTLDEIRRVRPCRPGVTAARFRLVLARCMPTISEHGEIPAPEDLEEVAISQMWDAEVMWQALTCCPDFRLVIDDLTTDENPMGGCATLFIDITAEVRIPPLPIVEQIEAGTYAVRGATVREPEPGTYTVS